jgi:hypothetical protein
MDELTNLENLIKKLEIDNSHLKAALLEACSRCGGEGTARTYKGCENCIASFVIKHLNDGLNQTTYIV